MKNIDAKISILKGTNKVISSSQADWENLREGSNIVIDNGKLAYSIASSEKLFYIKSFSRAGSQDIKLDEFEKGILMVDDKIQLSYKEYCVIEANLDKEATESKDTVFNLEGYERPLKARQTKGEKQLKIIDPGVFKVAKNNQMGATFSFGELPNRKLLDYAIVFIDPKTDYILLDKRLPEGVANGKISCNKWIANLSVNFGGESKIGVRANILRDFTQNLGLIFMPEHSPVQSSIYNENLKKIDENLAAIRKKLNI